ncbi:hypothetical protein AC579_8244 [Pseudocercospora musae]|uniref:Uncharacterized protein n=1 Tax=Pseudocercospora musae TaxID=113226 RepID=A0A139IWB8_9PEZI|nr:hypothetical protein AC579_8244 [Pseudocercospora musae]
MCAPLTVNCQQRKHRLTITDRIVPCIDPGSKFCKSGEAPPSQTWQVSSTDCIGKSASDSKPQIPRVLAKGFLLDQFLAALVLTRFTRTSSQTLQRHLRRSQYGEKVWKINYGLEKKKSGKGGKCVVQ